MTNLVELRAAIDEVDHSLKCAFSQSRWKFKDKPEKWCVCDCERQRLFTALEALEQAQQEDGTLIEDTYRWACQPEDKRTLETLRPLMNRMAAYLSRMNPRYAHEEGND